MAYLTSLLTKTSLLALAQTATSCELPPANYTCVKEVVDSSQYYALVKPGLTAFDLDRLLQPLKSQGFSFHPNQLRFLRESVRFEGHDLLFRGDFQAPDALNFSETADNYGDACEALFIANQGRDLSSSDLLTLLANSSDFFEAVEPLIVFRDQQAQIRNTPCELCQWEFGRSGSDCPCDTNSNLHINIQQLWLRTKGAGVVVAVVDGGLEAYRPDFLDHLNLWRSSSDPPGIDIIGWDFVSPTGGSTERPPSDPRGHGTRVAAIIAGLHQQEGNHGIDGVAPDARIMVLRALGEDGKGSIDRVNTAICFAAKHGARIINLSLGTCALPESTLRLIQRFEEILFVAAAGNQGYSLRKAALYPAAFTVGAHGGPPPPNLISVGALNSLGGRWKDSNCDADIAAPGDCIVYPTTDSVCRSFVAGTSYSAAMVSGVAALLASLPESAGRNGADLRQCLIGSSKKSDSASTFVTSGELDASKTESCW